MVIRKLSARTHHTSGPLEMMLGWGFLLDALVGVESCALLTSRLRRSGVREHRRVLVLGIVGSAAPATP